MEATCQALLKPHKKIKGKNHPRTIVAENIRIQHDSNELFYWLLACIALQNNSKLLQDYCNL